jgi:hypothetical protein
MGADHLTQSRPGCHAELVEASLPCFASLRLCVNHSESVAVVFGNLFLANPAKLSF